ncbi:MAG: nucleotide exchange factor GrpE, partial [Sedimentisphaerales bacterium]|nr:nucleotide exchange factor GrpE [Sedimentisphaerales bacterium]
EAFDPNKHEALMHQPSVEVEPNAVCAELSRGYLMGERVLRPTRVAVAKAVEENAGPENDSGSKENE